MSLFERLSGMNEVELSLWFAEQKVITSHLYGANNEQKDGLMKSIEEAEKIMLQHHDVKFRIKEKNFKAEVCNKLIAEANEELIRVMEENYTQLQELMNLKTNIAGLEKELTKYSTSLDQAKKEKQRLETTLEHLKEKNAADEQLATDDMLKAKRLLKRMEDAVNTDTNMLDRKKRVEDFDQKENELEALLNEEKQLEALNKLLDDEVTRLQAMPFPKFCVKLASVMLSLNSYNKKITDLAPRYKEAQMMRNMNKSFPSQDGEESGAFSQNLSTTKFAPKVPSPLAQSINEKAPKGRADMTSPHSQMTTSTTTQATIINENQLQQNEEASLLEHEEQTREPLVLSVDPNSSRRSVVSSDIEVVSTHEDQMTQLLDEGDATMDENEGSKKKTDSFCKPYLVVRAMNGNDQEMQRQSPVNVTRDHEGSMEENEPLTQTTKMFTSVESNGGQSQGVSSGQFMSQLTNPQSQSSYPIYDGDMISQDVHMDDGQASFAFGQEVADGEEDFLNFGADNGATLEENGNASFNFGSDAVDNVLNLSCQRNAGDSFLNFMVNRSGSDSANNVAFDFDFDTNFGNSENDGNDANMSFNLDDINGGGDMNVTASAAEDFNFDF